MRIDSNRPTKLGLQYIYRGYVDRKNIQKVTVSRRRMEGIRRSSE
jgi:hypothetical protein